MEMRTRRLARRHITHGVAWTVPVVVVAGAAPAFAASGGLPPISGSESYVGPSDSIVLENLGTSSPEQDIAAGTRIAWQIHNSSTIDATITITFLEGIALVPGEPSTVALAAGQTRTVWLETTSSWVAGGTVTLMYDNGVGDTAAWDYQSRLTVITCATGDRRSACVSVDPSGFGSACPPVPAPTTC